MKQLLVLSGKGGTGKTTLVASFIQLLQAKAFGDCDVDAPNLHLVTKLKTEPKKMDYIGMDKAYIDSDLCVGCGQCFANCRFNAITKINGNYQVNGFACEGCSVCAAICPANAITMKEDIAGELMLYEGSPVFSTATLKMGSGTTGKLVSQVKQNLKKAVETTGIMAEDEIAIIDGSPGIGCPVIASISGVDFILVVTEPTVSGISDMKRVIEVANHFRIKVGICTNKYDVNLDKTEEIKAYAKANGIEFIGVIPYDPEVAKAINQGLNMIESQTKASKYIQMVFNKTVALLEEKGE